MALWSGRTMWRPLCSALIAFAALLIPLCQAGAAPTPATPEAKLAAAERRVAAIRPSSKAGEPQNPVFAPDSELRGRVAEARQILLQLQAFVEEAARTVELGDRLKTKRLENEQLKRSLQNTRAVKRAVEKHVSPSEIILSNMTRTVVRNWLKTIRLKERSDEAHQRLVASESSWLDLRDRVAKLRRTLIERRAQVLALRAESAALSKVLGRTRQQIDEARADIQRDRRQQHRIASEALALRRDVTSGLRAILVDVGSQ